MAADPRAEGPQTVVHALAEGWLWWARLPHDEVRAMVFVDQDRLRAEPAGPGRLFRRLVSGSERGAELLAGLPRAAPVAVCDASSYRFGEVVTSTPSASVRPPSPSTRCPPQACRRRCRPRWPPPPPSTPCRAPAVIAPRRWTTTPSWSRLAAVHHQQTARGIYAEHATYADQLFWRRRSAGVDRAARAAPRVGLDELLTRPVRLRAPAELRATACRVGDRIERRRALCAPQLDRPVGFLAGLPVGPLIETVEAAPSLRSALDRWERSLPPGRGAQIVSWLVEHGLLEPSEASGVAAPQERTADGWSQSRMAAVTASGASSWGR